MRGFNFPKIFTVVFINAAFIVGMIHSKSSALTRVALFPLVNKSGDRVVQWIAYAVAESFSRRMRSLTDFQVWDPPFLFGVDTLGWTMESDSLLRLHWTRWGWDAAVGGGYSLSDGAVKAELRLYTIKNGRVSRKKLSASAPAEAVERLCNDLFEQTMAAMGLALSKSDERSLMRPITSAAGAYPTYVAGYGYEMRRDFPAALTAYTRVVELDPSCAAALCRIGKVYAAGNAIDSARLYFKKCASTGPDDPYVVAEIADFYTDHELPENASAFIKENTSLLEQTSSGMKVIGKSFLLSGELQRAIAMLNRAIALGPVDLETDFIIGKAYLSLGDFANASDVFNRLIKYRPDCMRYYALLGTAYRSSGRLMESAKVLENAAKIEPGNVQVCMNLAQTYFAIGWYKDAQQLLLRAQEKAPEVPEIYVDLGVVLWHLGKHDEAAAMLKRAEAKGMTKQSVLTNEANILLLTGDINKAIAWYRKADKAGKKSEIVLMNLGNAYAAGNKLNEAFQCYNEVLRMSPDRLDVLAIQAGIAEKRKKVKDAEIFYKKIIDLSPRDEAAIERLVDIEERQGRFKEALEPLEAYLNDFPNNKKMLLLQADCYHKMEWYEVAIMKYQIIVRDFPECWEGYLGMGKCMYDAIRFKNAKDYDKAIYYLEIASDKTAGDPEPDYLIGMLYMDYKNYRELASDHWRKALAKTTDDTMRKTLNKLIAKARQ